MSPLPALTRRPPAPPRARAIRYVDNSQNAADTARTNTLLSMLHKRVVPVIEELEPVLRAFDAAGTGFLSKHDLLAGCATLGVVLNDTELETLLPLLTINAEHEIDYHSFVDVFASRVDDTASKQ